MMDRSISLEGLPCRQTMLESLILVRLGFDPIPGRPCPIGGGLHVPRLVFDDAHFGIDYSIGRLGFEDVIHDDDSRRNAEVDHLML